MSDDLFAFVPRSQFRPYYESLDEVGKRWYTKLLRGMVRFERRIALGGWPGEEVTRVYDLVREMKREIPELYFVDYDNFGSCTYFTDGSGIRELWFSPNYHFTQKESKAIEVEVSRRAKDLLNAVRGMSNARALARIHDWLIDCFGYEKHDERYVQEAPGPMLYGISVCEGVAKAFKWLCDRAGINCYVIVGRSGNGWSGKGEDDALHAWNIADFGCPDAPAWHHVDVTWDASQSRSSGVRRYDYFGLSDAIISVNHEPKAKTWYPSCEVPVDWYQLHGAYAEDSQKLGSLVKACVRQRNRQLTCRLRLHSVEALTNQCYPAIRTAVAEEGHTVSSFKVNGANYDIGVFTFEFVYRDEKCV